MTPSTSLRDRDALVREKVIPAIPGADFGGRYEVPSFTTDRTWPIEAARAETRAMRLIQILMLLSATEQVST